MQQLANVIDHTLLKPDATETQIDQLCDEALTYQFATVCVNPCWVSHCAHRLRNDTVSVCTVVGFPLGAMTTAGKVAETADAMTNGAQEIDMVMNVGWLKSNHLTQVERDIAKVLEAASPSGIVKVILETSLLTDEEKRTACQLAQSAGAHFVKTSTGFASGGANVADVRLMRETVGPNMGVKAAGGIRTRQTAEAMLTAGANRIGASASVAIVK